MEVSLAFICCEIRHYFSHILSAAGEDLCSMYGVEGFPTIKVSSVCCIKNHMYYFFCGLSISIYLSVTINHEISMEILQTCKTTKVHANMTN